MLQVKSLTNESLSKYVNKDINDISTILKLTTYCYKTTIILLQIQYDTKIIRRGDKPVH